MRTRLIEIIGPAAYHIKVCTFTASATSDQGKSGHFISDRKPSSWTTWKE